MIDDLSMVTSTVGFLARLWKPTDELKRSEKDQDEDQGKEHESKSSHSHVGCSLVIVSFTLKRGSRDAEGAWRSPCIRKNTDTISFCFPASLWIASYVRI